MAKHICQYCGLTTEPLAYHEGAADCQAAMREFTTYLRIMLGEFSPFISCWEHEPWATPDAEDHFKEIAKRVGYERGD